MNTQTQNRKQQINPAGRCPAPRSSSDVMRNKIPMTQAAAAARSLARFITPAELESIGNACEGEEGEFFKSKLVELANLVSRMPTTYETDGQGDQAVAHLHYFTPTCDWYITERDSEEEQLQAFGLACVWEEEVGYISIQELIEAGAELDLYWTPKTLSQVKTERQMTDVNYVGHPMHY